MKTMIEAALAGATAGMLALGVPANAHHAVFATTDMTTTVEAKAVLTKVDWINPHVWLHFDLIAADGTVQKNVMLESLAIGGMRQVGIARPGLLNVGDPYTVGYYPNRNGEPGGFMNKLVMKDGTSFDTTPGRGRFQPGNPQFRRPPPAGPASERD